MAQYNKRQSGNGMLYAIIAVVLACAIAIASVLTTGYLITGTVNVKKWSNQTQLPAPDTGGDIDSNEPGSDKKNVGNNVILTPDKGYGISLMSALIAPDEYGEYGISPQAETAYEIMATPNVSGVTDFTWTINWKNASSTWAKGKSIATYINFNVAQDNPLKAVVSIKEAFGEQAIINCTYNFNSNIKVSCTVNYIKHITNVSFPAAKWFASDLGESGTDVILTPEYGIGTIEGDFKQLNIWGELSDEAYEFLINTDYYTYWQNCFPEGTAEILKESKSYLYDDYYVAFSFAISDFIRVSGTSTGNSYQYLSAMFHELAISGIPDQLRLLVDYRYEFDGDLLDENIFYGEYGRLSPGNIPSTLHTVSNITFDKYEIYFY